MEMRRNGLVLHQRPQAFSRRKQSCPVRVHHIESLLKFCVKASGMASAVHGSLRLQPIKCCTMLVKLQESSKHPSIPGVLCHTTGLQFQMRRLQSRSIHFQTAAKRLLSFTGQRTTEQTGCHSARFVVIGLTMLTYNFPAGRCRLHGSPLQITAWLASRSKSGQVLLDPCGGIVEVVEDTLRWCRLLDVLCGFDFGIRLQEHCLPVVKQQFLEPLQHVVACFISTSRMRQESSQRPWI